MKLKIINWLLLVVLVVLGIDLVRERLINRGLRGSVVPIKARIPDYVDEREARLRAVAVPTNVANRYLWRISLPDGNWLLLAETPVTHRGRGVFEPAGEIFVGTDVSIKDLRFEGRPSNERRSSYRLLNLFVEGPTYKTNSFFDFDVDRDEGRMIEKHWPELEIFHQPEQSRSSEDDEVLHLLTLFTDTPIYSGRKEWSIEGTMLSLSICKLGHSQRFVSKRFDQKEKE